jgi:hypothetical protein
MKKSREDEFWKEKAASDWNIKLYLLFSFVSSYFQAHIFSAKSRQVILQHFFQG